MKKKGRLSQQLFFAIILVSTVLFSLIYRNTLYISIFGSMASLIVYILLIIFFGLLGVLVISKHEKSRNLLVAIGLGICPLSVYTFIAYITTRPKTIIIAIVVCIVLVGLYCGLLMKNSRVKHKLNKVLAVAVSVITIVGIFPMGIFMADTLSGDGPIHRTEINYSDDSATLQKNLKVMKRFEDKAWSKLSLEERKETIETAKQIEAKSLGLAEDPKLVIKSIPVYESDGAVAGQYDVKTKTIFIDLDYIKRADKSGRDVLTTLCHECYHYYQQELVQEWKSSEQKTLMCYNSADIWNKEFKALGDNQGTQFGQYCELTAVEYAKTEADEYFNMMKVLDK